MAGPKKIEGISIDQGEITVAAAAIRHAVSQIHYMGMNVGDRVSDEQVRSLAVDVVTAIEKYRAAPSI